MSVQLVCPSCHRSVKVLSAAVTAECACGIDSKSLFYNPTPMIPIEQLTEQKANA